MEKDTVLKMRSKESVIPVVLAAPKWIDMSVVLVTAAGLRLLLLFFFHADVGDTPTYELLAENILRGCGLSFSEPTSASCILASGGYFPSYPDFMALTGFCLGTPTLLFSGKPKNVALKIRNWQPPQSKPLVQLDVVEQLDQPA